MMALLSSEQKTLEESHKKPNRKLFFVLAFLGVIVLSVAFLWWLFGRKSAGIVWVSPPPVTETIAPLQESAEYRGNFVWFRYPATFLEKPFVEPTKPPMLERLLLVSTDFSSKKIALVVQERGNLALEEYSAFRMRDLDSGSYTKEKIRKNGLDATIFIKSSVVFEATAFLERGDLIASVSVSSPTGITGLREILIEILENFSWAGA